MDSQFWSAVTGELTRLLVTLAASGGLFWLIISKAVDAQFTKRSVLFTRVDQRRADSVLNVYGELKTFLHRVLDFNPRHTYEIPEKSGDPVRDVWVWSMSMKRSAVAVLEQVSRIQLFLPDQLSKNVGVWIIYSEWFADQLFFQLSALSERPEYCAMPLVDQRNALDAERQKFYGESQWNHYFQLTHRICDDFAKVFFALDGAPSLTDLPPIPVEPLVPHDVVGDQSLAKVVDRQAGL